jgi:putative peptide zinc metalloprotease protein
VGAGVLTQVAIAAIAFWTWEAATDGSWLDTSSYLLMMAALLTVALNLNPLAKFDGYYLAVAVTGINNLRSRSFKFYSDLLHLRPSWEKPRDRWILAAYAPLSFLYILSVFGFILFRFANFALSDFRETTLMLLVIWLIYFYFPRND